MFFRRFVKIILEKTRGLRLDFLCVLLIAFDSIYHMASNIMYLHIGSKGLSMYELTVPPILSLLTTLFVFQSTAVNPRRCAHLGFSFSCSNTSRSSFNSIMNHEQKKHLKRVGRGSLCMGSTKHSFASWLFRFQGFWPNYNISPT